MALISSAVKSVDDSDRVNVNCACSPAFNVETSDPILIVGSIVSTERVIVLEAASFAFPAASKNLSEETLITPSVLLSSVGVNVAV